MLRKLRKKISRSVGLRLARLVRAVEAEIDASELPAFANKPANLRIQKPWRIANAGHIFIGDGVSIGPGCLINAIRRYPGRFLSNMPEGTEIQEFDPEIRVGNRVSITGYLGLSAVGSVTIEDDVIIASHVFISDNSHGRSNADVPYKYQALEGIAPVVIGRGSWIGEHVVIMPGVSVGEMSIVGANSVVTRDVPARSIVAGSPASVIRQWSEDALGWVKPRQPE